MPNSHALYIGGEWVAGAHAAQPNQNPSDLSDTIGHYDPVSYTHLTLPTNREV